MDILKILQLLTHVLKFIHIFFYNVKVSMFETRELFEYAKERVRRYVDT